MHQKDDPTWAALSPDGEDPSTRSLGTPEKIAAAVALLVLIGIVVFWPSSSAVSDAVDQIGILGIPREFREAEVGETTEFPCLGSESYQCVLVRFDITTGEHAGLPFAQEFSMGTTSPDFEVGDVAILSYVPPNGRLRALTEIPCEFDSTATCTTASVRFMTGTQKGQTSDVSLFPGQEIGLSAGTDVHITYDSDGEVVAIGSAPLGSNYQFADFQRRSYLGVLILVFAAAVIGLGRWRGVSALAALGVTFLVVIYWLIPSLLSGNPSAMVALVGAAAIAYLALYVSHGFSRTTTIALLGTVGALSLTTLLSVVSVHLARFSGFSSEESTLLVLLDGVDVRGLLLAGIVIGAAGALDDVTITQSSTVAQLRAAVPDMPNHELFTRGMAVGRAHVGSIVNTLVLAYLGAALPLAILFVLAQQSLGTVINSEVVAVEIVRALIGTLGIIAAVPLTTWLATLWPSRIVPKH